MLKQLLTMENYFTLYVLIGMITIIIIVFLSFFQDNNNDESIEKYDKDVEDYRRVISDYYTKQDQQLEKDIIQKLRREELLYSSKINNTSNRVFESHGERIAKIYLQKKFNAPFVKTRPKFLTYPPSGRPLELDLFNERLGIAVEYHGVQHFKSHVLNRFNLRYQQDKDNFKRRICRKLGILLIEIPYTIKEKDIPSFLEQQLTN